MLHLTTSKDDKGSNASTHNLKIIQELDQC